MNAFFMRTATSRDCAETTPALLSALAAGADAVLYIAPVFRENSATGSLSHPMYAMPAPDSGHAAMTFISIVPGMRRNHTIIQCSHHLLCHGFFFSQVAQKLPELFIVDLVHLFTPPAPILPLVWHGRQSTGRRVVHFISICVKLIPIGVHGILRIG